MLRATARGAAGGIIGFFTINGDAKDAGAGGAEGRNLFRAEVLGQNVVGDVDRFLFLQNDIFKAVDVEQLQVGLFLNGAGDTAGIHFGSLLDLRGQGTVENDVGYTEMASRFEDAVYFLDDAMFVGYEIEDTVGDDYVGDVACYGHFFNITLTEFDVVKAELISVLASLVDHGGSEINTDDLARFAGFGASDEGVVAGSGPQVDDDVAFLDASKLGRKAAAQAQVGVRIVAFEGAVIVGHNIGGFDGAAPGAAARGLVVFFVLEGDGAVFLADEVFELFGRWRGSLHDRMFKCDKY
jgi:hypothetical protein